MVSQRTLCKERPGIYVQNAAIGNVDITSRISGCWRVPAHAPYHDL
jgi:hypothetical protein